MKTKSALITYFASLLLFGSNGVVASAINMSSIGVVFYRSVLGSALLLILFMAGKNRIEFAKYKKDIFFIALSAVLMAALILREVLSPVQILGACLIIGGALLGEAKKSHPEIPRTEFRVTG